MCTFGSIIQACHRPDKMEDVTMSAVELCCHYQLVLATECSSETNCWWLIFTNEWPESESLHLTRKPQEAKESQRFPARLPHEDQLHVRQDEAVSGQRDLCPDNLPVGEGRNGSWPWHSLLLRRTGTSQWARAHRMGQQPHGAADQRQGKAFTDYIKSTHSSTFCDGSCWFWYRKHWFYCMFKD